MNLNKTSIYIKSILIPVILGGIIGLLISKFMDYNYLQKPVLAPPGIVFPIVWTLLYILMGVSYGILKSNKLINKEIDLIYYLQLGFNALWSIFFFIFKWRFFSSIWILILAILIFAMVIKFLSKSKIAGLLQIPYLIWVLFATYLNISIYLLNK
jgi:tryptophan-rich sensory protein